MGTDLCVTPLSGLYKGTDTGHKSIIMVLWKLEDCGLPNSCAPDFEQWTYVLGDLYFVSLFEFILDTFLIMFTF